MTLEGRILVRLETAVSPAVARAVLRTAREAHRVDLDRVSPVQLERLSFVLRDALTWFGVDRGEAKRCARRVASLASAPHASSRPPGPDLAPETTAVVPIRDAHDVALARIEGKAAAATQGFRPLAQVMIATAISELARNIVQYAGAGEVVIRTLHMPRPGIEIVARDEGPGISDLDAILSGSYRSLRGLGAGLRGTKKLMSTFDLATGPTGTTVTTRKFLR